MKNICIVTSFTDHIRWNDYGKCDYGDFSSINHHDYANKHGYSYIKKIVRNEDYHDWHPTWIKIDVLRKYIKDFDYIVWIDSDAVFCDQEIKIEDFIQDDVDLVIPKMEMDREHNTMWTHTSTGFMIWKNTDWSRNMLDLLWETPNEYRTQFFHEQSRLDQLIFDNFLQPNGKNILNKEFVDIVNPVVLNNIKIIPFSFHRCYNDGEIKFIYHAGGDTPTKLSRIKEVLSKK